MNSKQKGITLAASLGGLVLLFILVFGTMWTIDNSRKDTDSAVHSVSLLYLDELAGRREQVVSANMQEKINVIETALDMLTEEDLSDGTHLQAYQTRIKLLFKLERFAFIGADGLIYTATGPRADMDLYHIDYNALSGPEIMVENLEQREKPQAAPQKGDGLEKLEIPVQKMRDFNRLPTAEECKAADEKRRQEEEEFRKGP